MKTCIVCKTAKPLTAFSRDRRSPDGLLSRCRECTKLKNRVAYAAHADERRAAQRVRNQKDKAMKSDYNRQYRNRNKDKLNQYTRDWRAAGNKANRSVESKERGKERSRLRYATDPVYRESVKAYSALYRKQHPVEHLSAGRRWRANNLDHSRKYQRDYQREFNQTPEGRARQAASRIKHRAKRQARRAVYYASRYGTSGEITNDYLNWLHRWQDHCCCYCNDPLRGKETIEHVVPLSRGGENNPHNVLLACRSCNTSKNDRLFDDGEWLPRITHPPLHAYSTFATDRAATAIRAAGLVAEKRGRGTLALPNGRELHVLSSFWMSDRSDRLTTIEALHAAYPDDLLTFDYEWIERPDALLNVVTAKAGAAESVGARELEIASPSSIEARAFMSRWHVQGFAGGSWYVGLRASSGEWLGMASFRRLGTAYELARLAFRSHVSGGLSRIVTAFIRAATEPGDLLTYVDTRFGDGAGYVQAGFEPDGETVPWYGYVNGTGIHARQAYRKDAMATSLDWFDPEWPEHRLARVNGLWRLDGLPQKRFILYAT